MLHILFLAWFAESRSEGTPLMKSTAVIAFLALAATACGSEVPTDPAGTASQDLGSGSICLPIPAPLPQFGVGEIDRSGVAGGATISIDGGGFEHDTCRSPAGGDTVRISVWSEWPPSLGAIPFSVVTVTSTNQDNGWIGTVDESIELPCRPSVATEYYVTAIDQTTGDAAHLEGLDDVYDQSVLVTACP
jgi:hypothetical protein